MNDMIITAAWIDEEIAKLEQQRAPTVWSDGRNWDHFRNSQIEILRLAKRGLLLERIDDLLVKVQI